MHNLILCSYAIYKYCYYKSYYSRPLLMWDSIEHHERHTLSNRSRNPINHYFPSLSIPRKSTLTHSPISMCYATLAGNIYSTWMARQSIHPATHIPTFIVLLAVDDGGGGVGDDPRREIGEHVYSTPNAATLHALCSGLDYYYYCFYTSPTPWSTAETRPNEGFCCICEYNLQIKLCGELQMQHIKIHTHPNAE